MSDTLAQRVPKDAKEVKAEVWIGVFNERKK
jgi:hypothetical protein